MPRAALTCLALALCATTFPSSVRAQTAASFPSDSAALAIIRERVESKRSMGIVVGLLEADGRTRIVAYGNPGAGQPPLDGNSVFEIGSITKAFTATLLADMVQRGEVKLDDPVQKYLPAGVLMPARGGKQITLAHLAEQNSGLPRMPTNFRPANDANPFVDYTVEKLYDFLATYELTRDPGATYEYSNVGVGLLGHVLAMRAKQSYEELLRTRIWQPLGMSSTSITMTPAQRARLAKGHNPNGDAVPNWEFAALAGAGAILSTAGDMLKFLAAAVDAQRGPLGEAMALATRERAPTTVPVMGMGLGWHVRHAGADTIVWHNGGTGGYRSFAGVVPRKRTGVVVLTNSGGEGADDIGYHLLSPSLPLAPPRAPAKQRTAIEVSAEVLERYVGRYEFVPSFAIDVTREGDALYGQATGQSRFRLWPESETEFFLKEVDAQITFTRDASGAVTGLVLHQGGQTPAARKVK